MCPHIPSFTLSSNPPPHLILLFQISPYPLLILYSISPSLEESVPPPLWFLVSYLNSVDIPNEAHILRLLLKSK